jgi:hypothetical protein
MQRWLIAGAVATLASGSAGAGPMPSLTAPLQPLHRASHRPDLRLVQQVDFSPSRIRQSGMIADTAVLPNARLGLGLFSVSRNRRGANDARIDGRPAKSRKLGVSFRMRF